MLEERCFQKIAVLFASKVSPTKLIDFRWSQRIVCKKFEGMGATYFLKTELKCTKKLIGLIKVPQI